ncbi:uncharacterized protein [Cardiocondyla obscurior]|uniref:uncharacterized protein n=1 Tax=Cardiocondyla obscurior TaxID=286306 RepID=UPI00396564BA
MSQWGSRLMAMTPDAHGFRVIGAVRPHFQQWMDGVMVRGVLWAAQVVTGHGAFGDYLCRIGRSRTPKCWECDNSRDSADHTLAECPAFVEERAALRAAIGDDLSLPAVIKAITEGEAEKKAFFSFCEAVISQKEENERAGRRSRAGPSAGGDPGVRQTCRTRWC